MSTASSRLFKMLIDVNCFPQVSWTGKGKNVVIKFKEQGNIIKVLLETLKLMDNTYTEADLHDDVVYKILKFGNSKKNAANLN